MIVVDTSAVVALLRREVDADRIVVAIGNASELLISAVSAFEARMVMGGRYGDSGTREFDLFLHEALVRIEAFDADQAFLAYTAFRRYGKGMGHPAQLNMGDCAAYALAKSLDLPLLYIGDDFSKTDVKSAL